MQFPSMQLYDNQLKCDDSVREISLVDLPGVEINDDTMTKCIWYDTQGGEFPEQISESIDGDSKYNDMELLVVKGHIKKLLSSGVQPQDIGVIAPYSAQVQNLKNKWGWEVKLVVVLMVIRTVKLKLALLMVSKDEKKK